MNTTNAGITSYPAFNIDYGLVQPGTTVGDRFEIVAAVERSRSGNVFRARDRVTGSDVAIKVVRDPRSAGDRFAREIELLAQLEDAHVVRHVAHGTLPSGDLFLALEWLDADALWDRMTVGFTARRAVEIGAAIARGLAAVHARGIVHRDLSPANVLVARNGNVKLIDFGLAWAPDGASLTQTGSVLGSLGYIAPEQIAADGRVDARADLFALGCVLYLLLTGQPAFHSDTLMGMQARIMFEHPIAVRDRVPALPRELGTLVERLLAKDPAARPATAFEVATQLDALAPSLDDVIARPFVQRRARVRAHASAGRSVVVVDAAPERVAAVVRGAEMTAMLGGGALLATLQSDEAAALVDEMRRALPNARVWVEHVGGAAGEASSLGLEDTAASEGTGDATDATLPRAAMVTKSTERYEFKRVIGQGGLGRVLLAHDRELDRPVAIKELLRRTPVNNERFRREALVTARLQHPNIVPVHDAGQWPNGSPFYAMKLVEGDDLTKLIERAPDLAARLALLPKVSAVCEAMAYAHDRRIIHRDLKPSNIVVGEFGEALIVDWGLAKDLDAEEPEDPDEGPYRRGSAPDLTRVGDVVGTPAYMAPEQARGERVDQRADVYALGAMLYHVLCGHAPYADVPHTTLRTLLERPPNPLEQRAPDAPVELLAIVRKAMARDPADRYASALELARELRRFETGQLVSAHRYSLRELVRKWVRRHRTALVVVAIAAVALLVVGAYALFRVIAAERVAQDERVVALAERGRAEAESLRLRVLNAEQALARDPTEALAWLAIDDALPEDLHARATAIATKAVALGVAHTVHQLRGRIHWLDAAGDHVAAASRHGQVHVWTHAGDPVLEVNLGQAAHVATLSRDGRQLLVGTADGRVRWWRRLHDDPAELRVSAPRHAAFVRDDLVAIASDDGTVTLWPATGAARTHAIHGGEVYALVAAGGDAITVAGDGDLVRTGFDGIRWRVRAHTGGANHVARAADDRLVTVGDDSAIRVWALADGGRLAEVVTAEPLLEVAAVGDEAIAAGDTKVLHRWGVGDAQTSTVPLAFPAHGLAARPGLQAAGSGPTVRVLRRSGEQMTLAGHPDEVERVVAVGEAELVSADRGGQIRFWKLHPRDRVVVPGRASTPPVRVAAGWIIGDETGAVRAFATDGTHRTLFQLAEPISLLRATTDASTVVAVAGKRTHVWRGGITTVIAVPPVDKLELNVDGSHVIALTAAGELQLWRTAPGALVRTMVAAKGFVAVHGSRVFWAHPVRGVLALDLATEPTAEPTTIGDVPAIASAALPGAVAIGSGSGRVQVLDPSGATIAARDFESDLFALARAGATLLFGGADGRIRAWQFNTGEVRTLVGHERWVHGIDVAPNERIAASWSRSTAEVRLWDLATGATRSIILAGDPHGAALDATASRVAIVEKTGALVIAEVSDLVAISPTGLDAWVRARTRVRR